MKRLTTLVSTAALLAALGAGCSSQPAAPSPTAPAPTPAPAEQGQAMPEGQKAAPTFTYDPCTLLTKADAKTVLAEDVNDAKAFTTQFPDGKSCRYITVKGADTTRHVELVIVESANLQNSPLKKTASEYYDVLYNAAKETNAAKVSDVSGVGEKAYWDGGLQVYAKDAFISVSLVGMGTPGRTDEANKAAAVKAALIAIGKM